MPKTNTQQNIFNLIKQKGYSTVFDIQENLKISPQMIHRHLKKMIEMNILKKQGVPPKVFYSVQSEDYSKKEIDISTHIFGGAVNNFSVILPEGRELVGAQAFTYWCNEKGFSVSKKLKEFKGILNTYGSITKKGIIDATQKIRSTTDLTDSLNSLYFLYPYSFPVFGKTLIANRLFYGKQMQNTSLISKVLDTVIPQIIDFINREKYDLVCFIPPSVPRKVQFMKELSKEVFKKISIPIFNIDKIITEIPIQQKSLKDTRERVRNAEKTMIVSANIKDRVPTPKKILLIDDFVGSGATLSVIAKKIKLFLPDAEVDGLAITGSLKGFDIIREA